MVIQGWRRIEFNGAARLVLAAVLWCPLLLASWVAAAETVDCRVGSYQLSDGSTVDIAPSEGDTLRWRRFDGTTGALSRTGDGTWNSTLGWTGKADGVSARFSDCEDGRITFAHLEGRRVTFDVRETTFVSKGVTLAGRLTLPRGSGPVPLVVLVQGSESNSARDANALQRMLPAAGIGSFVFDKRGTGASGGEYTQDYNLLADDLVMAMREAKRLAAFRAGHIGYQGGSQAGWVIPIAVNREHVDFAIVCFGLAVSAIDEDQQQVQMEMREKGRSSAEIASALQVASAAERVISSRFTQGFSEFDAIRALYKDAPWYKELHGNYTYMLLPYSETELRAKAAEFAWSNATPFDYDPMPALRSNTTPQLWILGSEDYEAPSAETSLRIKSLIADGRPLTLAIYPGAEHGMTLFEKDPASGERLSTRYAPRYFAMIRDYARSGNLHGVYGDAEVTRPRSSTRFDR